MCLYVLQLEKQTFLQILRKPDGGSRGFGFVTYKDEMSVEKCLVMQHSLSGKTVELKRAVKKEEMSGGGGGMGMGGMGMSGGGGYGMAGGAGTFLTLFGNCLQCSLTAEAVSPCMPVMSCPLCMQHHALLLRPGSNMSSSLML